MTEHDGHLDSQRPPDPTAAPQVPAGWYPHPSMVGTQRYWDGHAWTDHIAPGVPTGPRGYAVPAAAKDNSDSLHIWGIIAMVFLPIGGFVIGVILYARGKTESGVLLILFSLASMWVWYMIWSNAITPDPVYYGY